jgi:hypothetical protein
VAAYMVVLNSLGLALLLSLLPYVPELNLLLSHKISILSADKHALYKRFDFLVEMVHLLMTQLSLQTTKESQEEADEFKKIISDMTDVVANVAKDILPDLVENEVCGTDYSLPN